jgi:hypothetical protein
MTVGRWRRAIGLGHALLTVGLVLLGCQQARGAGEQAPATRSARPEAELEALWQAAAATGSMACPAVTAGLGPQRGALYYAGPTGDGTGLLATTPGRLETILEQLVPGDTVIALAGDYGSVKWPEGVNGRADAPITLRADHQAVTITGEPPDLVAKPVAAEQRTTLSLALHDIESVRIEGIYGAIEVEGGGNIELRGNHHFQNPGHNLQLFDVDAVSVHHSLFENYRLKPGSDQDWHTDYGIAAYLQTRLAVHHILFSGGFNHAISLKERNQDVTISCNRFVNCGRHCLELGQQTDGRAPGQTPNDRTSSRVLVQNNLIEKTEDRLVNADFAVMIMNVDDIELVNNRFAGFDYSVLVSSYWAPSYCSDLGEAMSQVGVVPGFVRLADNEFRGETNLRFTGRGVEGDLIEASGMKGGPVSCEVRTLAPITCDDACCRWDPKPATEAAPTVRVNDRSLTCEAYPWSAATTMGPAERAQGNGEEP